MLTPVFELRSKAINTPVTTADTSRYVTLNSRTADHSLAFSSMIAPVIFNPWLCCDC